MQNNIERRVQATPIRLETRDDGSPVIRGLAAVYNKESRDLNGFREIIKPGAFRNVLAGQDHDVICCWNHDPAALLGRTASGTLRLFDTDEGLAYEVDPPDTALGRDMQTMVRRGDVFGSSFAFTTTDELTEWDDETNQHTVRTVSAVTGLYDVSLVTNPAYMDSSVAIRSFERWKTEQEAERMPPRFSPSLSFQKTVALARAARLEVARRVKK